MGPMLLDWRKRPPFPHGDGWVGPGLRGRERKAPPITQTPKDDPERPLQRIAAG